MIQLKTFLILLPLLLLQLCSEDNQTNDCEDLNISITSLESEYDCLDTRYQLNIDLVDNFELITSQEEFVSIVSGDCQPMIDFTTYDLVVGKQQLTNGNETISYDLILDCKTSNLELTITFIQNETDVAPNLAYHVLMPKLLETQTLTVDIIIN
ncbi:hypothetical protein WNY78_14900 [Psychroserpens sp. AS72]|uniref:hypothetical protein n=1 Tax=Psychroserpens sp. AS72 TaxID=3135775 RepID=UPI00316F4560